MKNEIKTKKTKLEKVRPLNKVEYTDALETAEQIKDWSRFKPMNDQEIVVGWVNGNQINYWKWACIAILLGIVVSMITMTPTITKMFDVCTIN